MYPNGMLDGWLDVAIRASEFQYERNKSANPGCLFKCLYRVPLPAIDDRNSDWNSSFGIPSSATTILSDGKKETESRGWRRYLFYILRSNSEASRGHDLNYPAKLVD